VNPRERLEQLSADAMQWLIAHGAAGTGWEESPLTRVTVVQDGGPHGFNFGVDKWLLGGHR